MACRHRGDFSYDPPSSLGAELLPPRMPIRLADNSIIYSSGVGTVVFNPVIDGKPCQPVEFTRVLHVPLLQNNLLACLYLTRHKGIKIGIDLKQMDFVQNGKTLFCAPIGSTNCAHLSGSTEPPSESANWDSTLLEIDGDNLYAIRGC